jgi:hypothetical protein
VGMGCFNCYVYGFKLEIVRRKNVFWEIVVLVIYVKNDGIIVMNGKKYSMNGLE